jgi:hypothetical protein
VFLFGVAFFNELHGHVWRELLGVEGAVEVRPLALALAFLFGCISVRTRYSYRYIYIRSSFTIKASTNRAQ